MCSICGINCEKCNFSSSCKGCKNTCGKPFGGDCIAANYIMDKSQKEYLIFKVRLLNEINELLSKNALPLANNLFELNGAFVNLEYTLPNGERKKFLDDKNIYLGCQIEVDGDERCYGVVADNSFILVSSYLKDGLEPILILYKTR